MTSTDELLAVLERLEARESELLCWGDTGSHFTIQELEAVIAEVLPEHDAEEVEDELRRQVMIVPVLDSRECEIGIKTRMGEAVHLYRNLRQWFHGQPLEQARTLVSDFRFLRRKRVYPARSLEIVDLVPRWQGAFLRDDSVQRALREIVGSYRLSGFQARATERILRAWESHRSRAMQPTATIVCAGTGSGKTMAFYLPVMSSLAADVVRDPSARVRVLAIYPRKELLKDQFNEAWELSRKLDEQLLEASARKIRIGALFGETPTSGRYAIDQFEDHLHYRFLRCRNASCRGEMRWSRADIAANVERLRCHLCGHTVAGDEIALTRQSIASSPPDVLFTTTEMLNQRMADSQFRHLFGIGVSQALPVVLLDEVHTYNGTQGAQTAMLLRRWMRLSGNRPHFVGLSATLRDATNFFAELTGTNRSRVSLVEPEAGEMVERGAEYLLALRGDPVSQTALLSTTIQAGMLTRRILDSSISRKSYDVWGTKTFLFTDDLDVNNRLFSGLADAEGWQQRGGQLVPATPGPLAQLRNASSSTVPPRKLREFGQDWGIAKTVGFSLDGNDRARVSRTSSQDTGYSRDSELIVTTASLEVGFNDLDVGAVIQHKAPRGVASYLQRKGRAGRPAIMRPWMLIVLSDYGRDRVAYQQYENLIDPEVKLKTLPTDNIHILKIHAAQAALDWLSRRFETCNIWGWLNQQPSASPKQRNELGKHIELVMSDGPERDELRAYIRDSLCLSEGVLNRVLWQAPRSVFLEFLPTLQRRLASNWAAWSESEQRIVELAEVVPKWGSPVPEFIPDSSFADLSTPDLHIRLSRRGVERWETMGYFQGLKEFAPGRISKRFAIETGALSDWLVPGDYRPQDRVNSVNFEIVEAFGGTLATVASAVDQEANLTINVYQPCVVLAQSRFSDRALADTSNAFLRWQSIFLPPHDGDRQDVPSASNWKDTLRAVTFYTHSRMSPLEIVRYSTGSDAEIKFRDGTSSRVKFTWTNDGRAAGVGSRLYVDAARFEFALSDDELTEWLGDQEVQRAVRVGIFQDQLREAAVFSGDVFAADWVAECFLAAVLVEAELATSDLECAVSMVVDGQSQVPLCELPQYLFQLDRIRVDSSSNDEPGKEQRLQTDLKALLTTAKVQESLRTISTCLYMPIGEVAKSIEWSRRIIGNTLAAAFHQALCTLFPHADEQSVNTDPESHEGPLGNLTVWLSEAESGGIGVISELQEMFAIDPLKVLNAVYRALQPGDYEQMDVDLHDALEEASRGGDLALAFENVRAASGYQERLNANTTLRHSLTARGFIVSHTFAAILHSRILKPGSNAQTDRELLSHLEQWREIENRCEIEVPINVIATVLAIDSEVIGDPGRAFDRACAIQSMLWVRGASVRQASLAFYNRFRAGNSRTERLLGSLICQGKARSVFYSEEGWLEAVHVALDEVGYVDLVVLRNDSSAIPRVLSTLHVKALDTHGLLLYPRVRSLVRRADELCFRIELPEAIH